MFALIKRYIIVEFLGEIEGLNGFDGAPGCLRDASETFFKRSERASGGMWRSQNRFSGSHRLL